MFFCGIDLLPPRAAIKAILMANSFCFSVCHVAPVQWEVYSSFCIATPR